MNPGAGQKSDPGHEIACHVTQGGAERVRPREWRADGETIWQFHRHFILTANTFRRSLVFVLHPMNPGFD
jgi:hypothetical protein